MKFFASCFLLFSSALFSFQKPIDIFSLFLPENPQILLLDGYPGEIAQLSRKWPKGRVYQKISDANSFDLIRFNMEKTDILEENVQVFSQAKVLYIDAILFPSVDDPTAIELKTILQRLGFILVARWNQEGVKATFIFVKTDYFYSPQTSDFLSHHAVSFDNYHIYPMTAFPPSYGKICYWLDDDPQDSIKQTLKSGYPYEGNISLMIYELVNKGSVAIDVGAHIGVHTIIMSRKAGPDGIVIAFEPNNKLYMELLANLQLNDCRNVISICKGVGDEEKKLTCAAWTLNRIFCCQEKRKSSILSPLIHIASSTFLS